MYRNTSKTMLPLAALLLTLASVALTGTLAADESTSASNGLTLAGGPLAIHGYDAVAYFTTGEPRRGLAKYSAKHAGVAYRFASKENLKTFKRDPEKYAPQFGGFCAYGVSVGKKFDGDPEVFKVVDGKLYFNLNPDIKATWEKDVPGNIAKAGRQWREIHDKPASAL